MINLVRTLLAFRELKGNSCQLQFVREMKAASATEVPICGLRPVGRRCDIQAFDILGAPCRVAWNAWESAPQVWHSWRGSWLQGANMKSAIVSLLFLAAVAVPQAVLAQYLPLSGGTMTGALNAPTINGILNAAAYCATPYTLDQSCVQNAVAAAASGQQIYVPAGTYAGTTSIISASNVTLILDPGANLNYSLILSGSGYHRSNTVSSAGSYIAGTTTFSGNFSAYTSGQTVLIEQINPTSANQIGLEFAKVSSASSTQLVLATGTRYAYSTPNISVTTTALQASGTTLKGSLTISGNFTSVFSVGNLVRLENTTSTDDVASDTNYFEILRVASINSSAITFESATHAAYGNPWLVQINSISNISIKGNGGANSSSRY